MNELVSVILPIYNVEKCLEKCVRSVMGQTYKNLEIILVDDGATDSSGAMCDEFAKMDERIVVIHKENAGLGFARNSGLEVAHGRYVMFIDSDDYVDIHAIEKCMKTQSETKADAVFFGRVDFFDDGREEITPVHDDKLYFEGDEVIDDLFRGMFTYERELGISAWACLIDLELLKRSGVLFTSERVALAEDISFWMDFFKYVSSAAILPEHLYYYYQNLASLSRGYKPGHQERNNAFLKRNIQKCHELGYPKSILDSLYVKYHIISLSGFKRILRCSMSRKEKRKELKKTFGDATLRASFSNKDALAKESKALRFFWAALRARLYFVCYLLLWYKVKR